MTDTSTATPFDDLDRYDGNHLAEVGHVAVSGAVLSSMTTAEVKIAELAQLSLIEYESRRDAEAKEMGFRVSVLDRMVGEQRPRDAETDAPDPFEAVHAWPDVVDGAALLSDIQTVIKRFCILPEHSNILMATWVLHAWTHDAADISPILAFVSPEKR